MKIVVEAIQKAKEELGDKPKEATKLINFLNSRNKHQLEQLEIEDRNATILEIKKVHIKKNLMLNWKKDVQVFKRTYIVLC